MVDLSADARAEARPLVAIGLGGRVELWDNEIRIIKGGVFGHVVELSWIGRGLMETTLFLDRITAVTIMRSLVLPDIIRFAYAGSTDFTDEYIHDALSENALIMNLFDNRNFFAIKEAVEDRIIGRRVRPALALPVRRRRLGMGRDRAR
jgi:hypothetical protein